MKKDFTWTEALDVKNDLLNDEHKKILTNEQKEIH